MWVGRTIGSSQLSGGAHAGPPTSCFLEDTSAELSRSTQNQAALGLPPSVVMLEDVIKLSVPAPDCSSHCALPDTRRFQEGERSAGIQCHLLNPERALLTPPKSQATGSRGSSTNWRRRGLEREKLRGKDPERGARPQREERPRPRECAPRERAGPARARGRAPDVALATQRTRRRRWRGARSVQSRVLLQ